MGAILEHFWRPRPRRSIPRSNEGPSLSDGPVNPSNSGSSNLEFGADKVARLAALEATQAFDMIDVHASTWSIELDPDQTMQLYSSYSNVTLRPDRERVIAEIGRIAQDEFGGRVTRNRTTILYVARRAV